MRMMQEARNLWLSSTKQTSLRGRRREDARGPTSPGGTMREMKLIWTRSGCGGRWTMRRRGRIWVKMRHGCKLKRVRQMSRRRNSVSRKLVGYLPAFADVKQRPIDYRGRRLTIRWRITRIPRASLNSCTRTRIHLVTSCIIPYFGGS